MNVQTIVPPPSITNYVSSIVVLENNSMFYEAVLPLIANGYPSIVFQLTDPARILSAHKRSEQLVLYGQNTSPIQLHTAGEIMVIAYFLYPHMLQPLFGYQARELTDRCIDLSLVRPARDLNLKEQLLNATTLVKRLQLMDGYILQLVNAARTGADERVSFATQVILKHGGAAPLTALLQELYMTERTLQRLFEQQVGLTPKMYSRVCQFNAAFRQLNQNRFSDMVAVALDNGYADQSHLIRAFRSFTNYSPLEYLRVAAAFPG